MYALEPTEENWLNLQECMLSVQRKEQAEQEKKFPEITTEVNSRET